jgi:hypothetical protein
VLALFEYKDGRMGECRRAGGASPFVNPATGEQGSRRSVSMAPQMTGRGNDCPPVRGALEPARLHLAPGYPVSPEKVSS